MGSSNDMGGYYKAAPSNWTKEDKHSMLGGKMWD